MFVIIYCEVEQKEILLLHPNRLETLKSGIITFDKTVTKSTGHANMVNDLTEILLHYVEELNSVNHKEGYTCIVCRKSLGKSNIEHLQNFLLHQSHCRVQKLITYPKGGSANLNEHNILKKKKNANLKEYFSRIMATKLHAASTDQSNFLFLLLKNKKLSG